MFNNLLRELKYYGSSLSILIVEDNSKVAIELKNILQPIFFKCDVAKDGLNALEKYDTYMYDIVITDINMPKINGLELTKKIKSRNKNQCIIIFSAYIDTFVIDLIDLGVNGLILKPFKIENFFQILCKNSENIKLKKDFLELTKKNNSNLIDSKENKNLVKNIKKEKIEELLETNKKININEWNNIKENIDDLNLNLNEIIDYILLNGVSQVYLNNLSSLFNSYYTNLTLVDGLEEFAEIFNDLSDFFSYIRLNDLNNKQIDDFDTYLFIADDIFDFFNAVFVEEKCKNTNYLTDSLKSSIYQMKCLLLNKEIEEEDIDFF